MGHLSWKEGKGYTSAHWDCWALYLGLAVSISTDLVPDMKASIHTYIYIVQLLGNLEYIFFFILNNNYLKCTVAKMSIPPNDSII